MIYCQLSDRMHLPTGEVLRLSDAAKVLGADVRGLTIPCPDAPGVWKLSAITVAALLRRTFPGQQVTMLGPDVCYVHRIPARHKDPFRPLRTLTALFVLVVGSALGLAWFHSDVGMPKAMELVYTLITGQPVQDARLITWPYAIGVALGVAVFYDVIPTQKAVTPLEIKLSEYQTDMEKAEGRDLPDA